MSTTKSFDPSVPFPDRDTARTHRQLRFVKALYRINDPELEQALAVVLERLADNQPGSALPPAPPDGPHPEPPRE
jgi:hypothetical protein